MSDFFMVFACSIVGLAAHGAKTKKWLEWLLRSFIFMSFGGQLIYISGLGAEERHVAWTFDILMGMCASTLATLVKVCREALSYMFTAVDNIISGQIFISLLRRKTIGLFANPIFSPTSVPHMVALFIYIQTLGFLLSGTAPPDLKMPGMPIPMPVQIDQLFTYNGLGLVLLAFCGVGIYVSRTPGECLKRLGLVKPSGPQIGIGIGVIAFSFFYDYLWSIYAQAMHQDLGMKLAAYNSGTFQVVGGFLPAVVLALATAIFAGIGEETLIRGACQPVFGILPAAILHGALHGQFAHAPFFIIEVAGWSAFMGIVKRYTNTSTTIIGHAGYNFLTTLLFAFNP